MLRTLQRRVKLWRRERANELVFGAIVPAMLDTGAVTPPIMIPETTVANAAVDKSPAGA
jgi:hypothetical protein